MEEKFELADMLGKEKFRQRLLTSNGIATDIALARFLLRYLPFRIRGVLSTFQIGGIVDPPPIARPDNAGALLISLGSSLRYLCQVVGEFGQDIHFSGKKDPYLAAAIMSVGSAVDFQNIAAEIASFSALLDAQSLPQQRKDMFHRKLFSIEPSEDAQFLYPTHENAAESLKRELDAIPAFMAHLASDPHWSFWADWFQGFLDGKPLDWELQRRVALIADSDWEQGPAHIATKIEAIQAAFLLEKLPLAERLELNPDTGGFRVVPIAVQNAPLVGAILARVADAVEDALGGGNGLREDSREVRVLTRALQRFGNDPQRLEMDFTSVAIGLRRQIEQSGELPASEDNLAVLEAVEEGARGLRAAHPEVAANRVLLAERVSRVLTADEKARLAEAQPVLEALSEGIQAEDFASDIVALINDAVLPLPTGAPRLPGADASARLFNRAAKMSQLWPSLLETGAAWHDSRAHKLVKVGFTAASVTSLLAWLVQLGLRFIGAL